MKLRRLIVVVVASVAVVSISAAGDTPSATTHIDAVAAFYGVSQDDIRYFPNELYDCLREYAALPESREALRIAVIDEQMLLKDAAGRLAADPSLVAIGLLGTSCVGAVFQRGATGMYEGFRESGKYGGGRVVNVVGGREVPPRTRKLEDSADAGALPLDEDHLIVRRDKDGLVKIRETYALTDGEDVALFGGEWKANFVSGTWDDYISGRLVVLTIPFSESERRCAVFREFLGKPEAKKYFRLAAALAIAEMSTTDDDTEPTVPDYSGMQVDLTADQSPRAISVFVRGDFLLWFDSGRDITRYEIRRNASE